MASKFKAFMNGPIGPKSVFFWAPAFKWGIVAASISDLRKPPQNLSTNQNLALAATGFIWARYSTQIQPLNWNLFAVNFFVGLTSLYQLYRKYDASKHPEKYPSSSSSIVDSASSSSSLSGAAATAATGEHHHHPHKRPDPTTATGL